MVALFDVVGQDFAKKAFERAYENNKISHAYIINGPDGIGKSVFACYIASKILCRGSKKPCGVCASCIKIKHGNHPDLKMVSTDLKSIGIDAVRQLIDEIYVKPYEGDKKVIIIKNADKITVEGQNAILKTLEEPPEDTTIIMLAENLSALLETIQSRCQVLRLGRIGNDKVEDYLIKIGTDREKAALAAGLSDGIPGNALKFLDKKYMDLRKETIDTARDIIRAGSLDIISYTDFFTSRKESIDVILDILTVWFRDIAVYKLTKNKSIIMNRDFYDILVEESRILSYNKLKGIIDVIKNSREKLSRYSNFQLTIEVMLLNIQEV